MKVLALANQKGGVGKTALVSQLAWEAAIQYGLKVVVIDLDTQGNVSYTLGEYLDPEAATSSHLLREETAILPKSKENNPSLIAYDDELSDLMTGDRGKALNALRKLKLNISRLERIGFDLCLIDTPPSLGTTMMAAIGVSDFVVSPIEMEQYSIDGLEKLFNLIENLKETENPKLQFLGAIPSKVEFRDPRHKGLLEELLKNNEDIILPHPIGRRTSVGESVAERKPIFQIKKTSAKKAADEFKVLAADIFQKMGITK